jgi:sulfur carrier protein
MVASERFGASVRPTSMTIHLQPQGKVVSLSGRRRVGDVVQSLGLVTGTVLVIRGNELLTDDEFLEHDDQVEVRAVISGGV